MWVRNSGADNFEVDTVLQTLYSRDARRCGPYARFQCVAAALLATGESCVARLLAAVMMVVVVVRPGVVLVDEQMHLVLSAKVEMRYHKINEKARRVDDCRHQWR